MPTFIPLSIRRRNLARANGAKSRGPITAAGKARSSRNALKHGLRTQADHAADDPAEISRMADEIARKYGPGNPLAPAAAHAFAQAARRTERILRMETAALNREMSQLPPMPATQLLVTAWDNLVKDRTIVRLYRYSVENSNRMHAAFRVLCELRRTSAFPRATMCPVPNEPGTGSTPERSIAFAASASSASRNPPTAITPVPNEPKTTSSPDRSTAFTTSAPSTTRPGGVSYQESRACGFLKHDGRPRGLFEQGALPSCVIA